MTCYHCNKLHRNHKNNNIIQLTQRNTRASMQKIKTPITQPKWHSHNKTTKQKHPSKWHSNFSHDNIICWRTGL